MHNLYYLCPRFLAILVSFVIRDLTQPVTEEREQKLAKNNSIHLTNVHFTDKHKAQSRGTTVFLFYFRYVNSHNSGS